MPSYEHPLQMFLALFALYSPLAAVSSYFPIVSGMSAGDQRRLALGLFTYVTVFSMTAIWVGEPLLLMLGITTAALTATGGIALIFVGIELMRGGGGEAPPKPSKDVKEEVPKAPTGSWRSVVFMPVTFPLTVGGTTFAIFVSYRALSKNLAETVALSVAGVAYAMVTGITVYASGHIERRVTPKTRGLLEKVAGILLTAIAAMLLAAGFTRMVYSTVQTVKTEQVEKSE